MGGKLFLILGSGSSSPFTALNCVINSIMIVTSSILFNELILDFRLTQTLELIWRDLIWHLEDTCHWHLNQHVTLESWVKISVVVCFLSIKQTGVDYTANRYIIKSLAFDKLLSEMDLYKYTRFQIGNYFVRTAS